MVLLLVFMQLTCDLFAIAKFLLVYVSIFNVLALFLSDVCLIHLNKHYYYYILYKDVANI